MLVKPSFEVLSMKVVQVYGGAVLGILGGHEYVVRRLSEELSKSGFKIILLCPTRQSRLISNEVKGVVHLEIPSYFLSARLCLPRLSFLPSIVNALRNADLVHVHCTDNPFSFIVALFTKFLRKRLVITVLAYGDDFKHHERVKRAFGFFTTFQHTIAIWLSNKVHVESQYDIDKLHVYKKKTVMIPPGIEDLVLKAKPSRDSVKKMVEKLKPYEKGKIILFLGRIHKGKGIFHALSALSILRETINANLVIAGPSNSILMDIEKYVRNRGLENNVIYLGRITDEEKIALLDMVDVVVVPSLSDIVEAYSIVSSEAWARKKPVVAYAVGALKYRIKPGINGYLARPLDQRDLANKIAKALCNHLNFKLPYDIWSWSKVTAQFRRTYVSLVETFRNSS
jgi:glycosyltransferase involved in cell wall biosynthesis